MTSRCLTSAKVLDEYVGRPGEAGLQFRVAAGARVQELQAHVSAESLGADQQRAEAQQHGAPHLFVLDPDEVALLTRPSFLLPLQLLP